jgi:FMN phosphatase YigB (HAD superfamily)
MRPPGVVFDLDGTLADRPPGFAFVSGGELDELQAERPRHIAEKPQDLLGLLHAVDL